jgi:hypothetical protein
MQHDAWAMQQLPPAAQQSELCDATSEVAFAVPISAATATIMKYFIVTPIETSLKCLRTARAEPAQIRRRRLAAAERAVFRRAPQSVR